MNEEDYKYTMKLIVIGNSSVGKSSILNYFLKNKCNSLVLVNVNMQQTMSIEFGSKIINLDNSKIKLQIWDTAGQERFKSITQTYYRGALGALIVYDITQFDTFCVLQQWIEDARSFGKDNITILVVGNKFDLNDARQIELPYIQQFCQNNKFIFNQRVLYIEASAKTGYNIQECFQIITKNILKKVNEGRLLILGEIDEVDVNLPSLIFKNKNEDNQQNRCCFK